MTERACEWCGNPNPTTHRTCSFACGTAMGHAHSTAAARQRRAELVEDVQWLIDGGATPEQVCQQLNVKPHALSRRLYRAGETETARRFERLATYERNRRYRCVDCGAPCSVKGGRCRTHAYVGRKRTGGRFAA